MRDSSSTVKVLWVRHIVVVDQVVADQAQIQDVLCSVNISVPRDVASAAVQVSVGTFGYFRAPLVARAAQHRCAEFINDHHVDVLLAFVGAVQQAVLEFRERCATVSSHVLRDFHLAQRDQGFHLLFRFQFGECTLCFRLERYNNQNYVLVFKDGQ